MHTLSRRLTEPWNWKFFALVIQIELFFTQCIFVGLFLINLGTFPPQHSFTLSISPSDVNQPRVEADDHGGAPPWHFLA